MKLIRQTRPRPVDREAYEAYLKGRFYWDRQQGITKAIAYFQHAIERDPGYAPAYAGLADSYVTLTIASSLPSKEYFPKAKEAAVRALAIDNTLAEAHASLGNTLRFYEWDWPGAEREFKRAIELNPSYAPAHRFYSVYLSGMGRHQEAIAEAKRSQQLDPVSLSVNASAGRCFYYARQYDQAFACLDRAFQERDERMVWLKVDPKLDTLRSDPRFAELLRRLRFPP